MPLARGTRLGPYLIDAEIGAGGMGHVFRATDTRLGRAVAIKVLPEHRLGDPQLRLRFEREARALSSLSHPNLCPLYDVGEVDNVPYLVMELLEGVTLRERINAGNLGTRKALAFGAQIAAGLAAAHAKGVVHRDLKPENIFVTAGELLKILDFGLATTTTTTSQLTTEPGMVMGTAYYMSPEQVRGLPLDARSDIFSLGVVLFEMLTGEVPFRGRSAVETMNAVLIDEPPDLLPEPVDALVRRCLEKEPDQRFGSARDLMFALEAASKSVPATFTPTPARAVAPPPAPAKTSMRTRAVILVIALASIIGLSLLSRGSFETPVVEPPRLRTLTSSGRDSSPAASPDGRLIAFVSTRDGQRRIWLEQLTDGTEGAVTAGPNDSWPRFSPDGSLLLFTRTESGASAIHRVAVLGGEPRKLLDNAFDGDWSPDGKQIAFIRNRAAGTQRFTTLCVAPADGGAVSEVIASSDDDYASPRWAPDGATIAVTRHPRGSKPGSLMLVNVESKDTRVLVRDQPHGLLSGAAWVNGGKALVYAELEAHASAGLPRRRGASALVLHDLERDRVRVLLRSPHSAADTVDVVSPGRLVFSEDATRQSLQEVQLGGGGSRWLSRGRSVDRQPSYARGGRSVVFASDRGGNVDVWELMLDSGSLRRLTDHRGVDWDPHPAGDTLFWSSDRGGNFEVWTAALDGASPQQVTRDGVDAENPSLPTGGDWIFYDSSNPKSDGVWRIPRGGGAAALVIAAETIHPEVSADGQYVVYQRPEAGGSLALDVARVADGKVFVLASGITGVDYVRARWMGSTHAIAFRAPADGGVIALFAQEFREDADTTATRRQLFAAAIDETPETFAISPDGKRAILSIIDEASGVMMAEDVDGVAR